MNKLLQQALNTPPVIRREVGDVSKDEEELAIAYLERKINQRQYAHGLNITNAGTSKYTRFHHAIHSLWRKGKLKLK